MTTMNPEDSQFKKWLAKELGKMKSFQRLTSRRYRNPQGYSTYESVVERIAFCKWVMESHVQAFKRGEINESDFWLTNETTERIALPLFWLVATKQAPFYWLTADLVEAFLATDIPPGIVAQMERPVSSAVFMLPKGLINTPDGSPIDHLCVQHYLREDGLQKTARLELFPETAIHFEQREEVDKIIYATSTSPLAESVYAGCAYVANGKFDDGGYIPARQSDDIEAEKEFTGKLTSIAIQTLLVMQAKPELVESLPSSIRPLKGCANTKKSPKDHQLLNPVWIGKGLERRPRTSATPDSDRVGGTRNLRYRRGHWRYLDADKGRFKESRFTWVRHFEKEATMD